MLQLVLTILIYLIIVIPVGRYMYHIAAGKHTFADPVFDRVDGVIYKIGGVNPDKGMNWKQYVLALIGTNAVMIGIGYLILRIQSIPFFNPNGIEGMEPTLSFNTIISFMTNTNLQHYSGESGLSYLSQMLVIIFMMFVSAATGYAACVAFIRGLAGKTKFVEITPKQKIKLGCFTVEPIHVNHSIPDSVAFAIDSPAGTIIQTGDFKIDYTPLACGVTDLSTLSEYGQRGVLALLSDSTNAERPGFTATEQKVAAGVRSLFARARNKRIIIATFASNIYRVQQIIDLAVEDGRKVAFSGRSMVNNTAMAQELGYMHIPEGTLISVDELNQYPPEQVVLITTGSQGEPLSALSRMASCSHRQVRVGPGDFIIISANPIPGNEKSVTKIVNGLLLLGAEVIYESMYDVHVSGHACQEEQKLMLTLTRPKYFLPVHGEYKQLKKHALTAASLGIPTSNILIAENGSNIILSQDEMKLGEPVTAGAVMVDGLGVGDVGNVVLRDRKHLSEDGLVIIVATVDSKTGKVLAGPDLVSRGFVYVRENESLMDGAQSIVENALDRCVEEHVRDWNSVKTRVREALSSYIYRRTKRSPMILPILMEV